MYVIHWHIFRKSGSSFLWLWVELNTRLQNGATRTNQLISVYVCLRVAANSELEIKSNSPFDQVCPNFGKATKQKTSLLKKILWVRSQFLYIIFSTGKNSVSRILSWLLLVWLMTFVSLLLWNFHSDTFILDLLPELLNNAKAFFKWKGKVQALSTCKLVSFKKL